MSLDKRRIPKDPVYRAGVYVSIDDVPEHHRLRNYENRFEGRDCWSEYIQANNLIKESHSRGYKLEMNRHEKRWRKFVRGRGGHHALCTPQDAVDYATHLFEDHGLSMATVVEYWCGVERFYRWMFHHTEYPHRYHPFVMAAVRDDTSHAIWMEQMTQEEP